MNRSKTLNNMKKGKLFIIAGPSGSGKDTLIGKILENSGNLRLSKSCTTRKMREDEHENPKYHFLTREKFETMIDAGELLEHNVYLGNYYGTPKKSVDDWLKTGYNVLLEIDVNGNKIIREKIPEATSIFIMPPSLDVLRQRLLVRGTETKEEVKNRVERAAKEIEKAKDFDYTVVNDDLNTAVEQLLNIIN